MMKDLLLVTGGAGFIGSQFIRSLLADAGTETCIVNLDALTYAADLANLAPVAADARYHFVHGDVRDAALLARLFADFPFTAVVHFAAESHVDRSISAAAQFAATNVVGTQSLLDAACAAWRQADGSMLPGRRFLQISTDEVYGPAAGGCSFREDAALAPCNPYAASKAAADLLGLAAWRTHGLPVMISRCVNNFGPGQHAEKLIPRMIRCALAGEALPVYGDGSARRDWLHAADHCSALRGLLVFGKPGEIYHIAAHDEYSVLSVVEQLLAQPVLAGGRIAFVADRPAHDMRYALDDGKLRRLLGWQPRHALADELPALVAWYQEKFRHGADAAFAAAPLFPPAQR